MHSENKEVIYTVRCAECGDRLVHKTDNSRKNTESWYCKNKDCKTVVRKTVAVLEDEITEPVSYTHLDVYKRQGDKGIPAQPEDMDAYFALEKQIMEKHHLKEPFEWE